MCAILFAVGTVAATTRGGDLRRKRRAEGDMPMTKKLHATYLCAHLGACEGPLSRAGRSPIHRPVQRALSAMRHESDREVERSKLSLSDAKRTIDEPAARGVASLSITGGEPMLFQEEVIQLLRHARAAGIRYTRTGTNGFLFTGHEGPGFEARLDPRRCACRSRRLLLLDQHRCGDRGLTRACAD